MRMTRVRTFLTVFMGCSKSADSEDCLPDPDMVSNFTMLVTKLNACVNHLEQFPIKMYDVASGPPGVRYVSSTNQRAAFINSTNQSLVFLRVDQSASCISNFHQSQVSWLHPKVLQDSSSQVFTAASS